MYQFNKAKLATLVDESGMKRRALAQKLGMHPRTLLRRLRDGGWTDHEIAVLADVLQFDPGPLYTLKLD